VRWWSWIWRHTSAMIGYASICLTTQLCQLRHFRTETPSITQGAQFDSTLRQRERLNVLFKQSTSSYYNKAY
jgi:hypothetical protein